jgi:methylaspartate mutase epsilon subunit
MDLTNVSFRKTLSNERWAEGEFLEYRSRVLDRWPTGDEIRDVEDCVSYSRGLDASQCFPKLLREARNQGVPLFQVGIGHTTISEQRDHMTQAVSEGVDLILTLTDTYTRKSSYDRAADGIARALKGPDTRVLNGFPIVNYGLETRELFRSAGVPIHISGNVDEEAMLSSEMGYAAGASCDFTHSLHDLVQHSRDYPLVQRIQNNQYVSRLAAHYTEGGAPIELIALANYQGLVPPGLGIAVAILSMLSSVAQGAKYISLHRCIEGSLEQDVAAFHAYRRVADHYLALFEHEDVDCVTHSWPWMGAWPEPDFENAALVSWCAAVSMLAGVDWIYLKSIHEGSGIPDVHSNLASIQLARELRRIIPPQAMSDVDAIAVESQFIEEEAHNLIDAALNLGDGDPNLGQVLAVKEGYLDIPMASWNGVADSVVAVRDVRGAVRYLNPGKLPLSMSVLEHHRLKVEERKRDDALEGDIALVIHDIRQYMNG